MKLRTIFIIGSLFAVGCSAKVETNTNTAANAPAAASGNTANANANGNANTVATNANANANTTKPVNEGPKRIAFSKGANWGTANFTLAPGASQKYIIAAKTGQTMDVEVSSKETAVNLIKGKAETTEDFGFLSAELKSNGDYVIEVKNISKKELKSSVKVSIESPAKETAEDGAEDNAEIEQ